MKQSYLKKHIFEVVDSVRVKHYYLSEDIHNALAVHSEGYGDVHHGVDLRLVPVEEIIRIETNNEDLIKSLEHEPGFTVCPLGQGFFEITASAGSWSSKVSTDIEIGE